MKKLIKFYGASWCPDCRRSKDYLDGKNVLYQYINIDEDEKAAEEVRRINKGFQSIPTIVFPGGIVLVEPSNQKIQEVLDNG